jgi:hypothetical protein
MKLHTLAQWDDKFHLPQANAIAAVARFDVKPRDFYPWRDRKMNEWFESRQNLIGPIRISEISPTV